MTRAVPACLSRSSQGCEDAVSGPGIGYLISRYPAISHTFILREILELRRLGWRIEVASINAPDRPHDNLPLVEQSEARSTFYVKEQGPARAIRVAILALLRRPVLFSNALFFALRLGSGSMGQMIKNLFYFAEALLVGEWLKRSGLKHLHVHFGTAAATVGLIASRAYPISFSLTIHGPDEFYDVGHYSLRQKVEAAQFVCCIASFTRSQLMRLTDPSCWGRLRLAPLGVDPSEFKPRVLRRDSPVVEVLCVGRLAPAKGQMILLRAIRQLLSEGANIRCRLIGDGPDGARLREFAALEVAAGSIVFEGALNHDRVHGFLEQADIFVLPSFAEGVPVALMEAMSMEVPCVSSAVAGIPELIRHSVDGLLVSASDHEQLASAIRTLVGDPDYRRRLGAAGRRRVCDRYDLSTNVLALDNIFKCELVKA
jgi:colanic acid/amylovoran biosynthesis glycosyltransferase